MLTDTPGPASADTAAAAPSKTFKDLITHPGVLAAVEALKFSAPTPVQAAVIPEALVGKDLIVQAKTGSGKTLAFVLPLLLHLEKAAKERGTIGLIVTPTRELASQICQVICSVTKDITPACIIGGESMREQEHALSNDNRIVVGTPGRIQDFLRQRLILLRTCQYFVLDEADEMLSMGFLEEVRSILSRLPDKRQGLFVSATITPRVEMLANSFLNRPERVVISSEGEEHSLIEHLFLNVTGELTAKANMLADLIESQRPRSAVIFCNTKSDTELVEVFLRRRGFDARRINSDLTQRERTLIMSQIRSGELKILIATDIAARGIDIESIDLVVNYSISAESEVYIHRTGRTGRAGRFGRAVALVGPQDFAAFQSLKRFVQFEIKPMQPPSEDDIVAARVSHFHEIVRQTTMEMQPKELLIARKLINDVGGLTEPPEEFVSFVSKMYRLVLEHSAAKQKAAADQAAIANSAQADSSSQTNSGEPQRRQAPRSQEQRPRSGGGYRSEQGGGNRGGGRRR
jgi:ATP-dependent RNA helicase DeaD